MNKTKEKILAATEKLITEYGFQGTTISQIAKSANVADSLAYQYFKGKEDILFSILQKKLKETHMLLDDYLIGIIDAKSQLSKFIWHGLKYNERNQLFVRNLVFECRTKKEFYSTDAYELIKKHSRKTMDILRRGVAEGIFRNDIDMRLVRDIMYGTIDIETISSLVLHEIPDSSDDLNDIMALILRMIEKNVDEPGTVDKKLNILTEAEKLFAKHGYTKTKISDIAKAANVSEGTIYDYFKTKENLLSSIAETRLNIHINRLAGAFHIESPMRKLRRFMRYHFSLFMKNRAFFKIFVNDTIFSNQFYTSDAYKTYKAYLKVLDDILNEGKEDGSFSNDVNIRVFKNMFIGSFTHMALRWIVFKDHKFDTMMEIDHLIDLLCTAVTEIPAVQ